MVVMSNPSQALNELAQFLGIKLEKEVLSVGGVNTPRFMCRVVFYGITFESAQVQSKDEAYKLACAKILEPLPFSKVPQDCLIKEGEGNQARFKGVYGNLDTPWFLKLNDASKHLMKMIVRDTFTGLDIKLDQLSLAETSIDYQVSKMGKELASWQENNLPKIRMILDLKLLSRELDSYLTVAFITSGYCISMSEKEFVSSFLGIPESSYDRLETLGDAVIGLAAITKFFTRGLSPDELTLKRASLVNEKTLAHAIQALGLDEFVLLRDKFVAPTTKVLSDIFEAIVGALWISVPELRDTCGERMLGFIHL